MIKTVQNNASVDAFLDTLPTEQQEDSRVLISIMSKITNEPPKMWGTSIIGFGTFHYKSAAGSEGDWMRIGFSPRKGKLSLYVTYDASHYTQMLDTLGKYKIGKGCIYINKLADVDVPELEKLIQRAYKESPDMSTAK